MDAGKVKELRQISRLEELHRAFPIVLERDVAWGEMDAYQHVNNVVYFRYFEDARVAYLTRSGWDAVEERMGIVLVVKHIEANYHQALHYPARIGIAARIRHPRSLNGFSFTMEYVVGLIDEGRGFRVVATGESEHVLLNNKTPPPSKVNITDEVRNLFISFEETHPLPVARRIPILGVVGRTRDVEEKTTRLAEEVGRAIVSVKGIVLTGGQPSGPKAGQPKRPVKDAAMDGAVNAGKSGGQARMIGILPEQSSAGAVMTQPNSNTYCLLVHTLLTSHERNRLTGAVPDVVIALEGGAGTLSEIAFARHAGRPVVFLDSFEALQRVFHNSRDEVQSIIQEVVQVYPPGLEADAVLEHLMALFQDPETKRTADPFQAVVDALAAIDSGAFRQRSLAADFPGVQDRTVQGPIFERQALVLSW